MSSMIAILREVRDPRDMNARHDLAELLFVALAATLCGAKSCVEIAEFAEAREDGSEGDRVAEARRAEPRHLQPGVPAARSGGVGAGFCSLHDGVARANSACRRRRAWWRSTPRPCGADTRRGGRICRR